MPSPFPGMDPFIEAQEWTDFHSRYINILSDQLTPDLRPRFTTRIERRVYVESVGDKQSIVPDVTITNSQRDTGPADSGFGSSPASSVATTIAPVECPLVMPVEHRESYLVIRNRQDQRVVTVIELLSPANKRSGTGRDVYLEKRSEVLASRTNLIELDFLRGGQRMPMAAPLPTGEYFAIVCRRGRVIADVYAWPLAHRLPVIPVPLDRDVAEVPLDLQQAFETTFERAAYLDTLRYSEPLSPPLSDEQQLWFSKQIKQASLDDVPKSI